MKSTRPSRTDKQTANRESQVCSGGVIRDGQEIALVKVTGNIKKRILPENMTSIQSGGRK